MQSSNSVLLQAVPLVIVPHLVVVQLPAEEGNINQAYLCRMESDMHISTDKKGSCLPNKCSAHRVVLRVDVPKELHRLENIKPGGWSLFSSCRLSRIGKVFLDVTH